MTRFLLTIKYINTVFFITIFSTCGSYDLGSAQPTQLNVNTTNPTWANDIQPLIEMKCMNCHATPKPSHSPGNAPALPLDVMSSFATYASLVTLRVFNSPSDPMPPNFGTPLYSNELTALQTYIASLSSTTSSTTTTTSSTNTSSTSLSLTASFTQNCAPCHGAQGGGGVGPKLSGLTLSESSFVTFVRTGSGIMPSFSTSQISDADLQTDYTALAAGL